MNDFSKATPRPWEPNEDRTGVLYTHGNMKFHVCLMGSGGSTTQTREQEINNVDLIVTAVNNYNKMKEALEKLVMAAEYSRYHSKSAALDSSIETAKQLLDSLK